MSRTFAYMITISLILIISPTFSANDESEQSVSCRILVDWGEDIIWQDENNRTMEIIHRYRVIFDPPFSNGSSPGAVDVSLQYYNEGLDISNITNFSSISAGGEVDISVDRIPVFGDSIEIEVQTAESQCSRILIITNWNQPIYDHEVTRETDWALSDSGEDLQGISFEGRGWQKRTGTILQSNELGNGSLSMNMSNGSGGMGIDLELDKIWLNETYDGTEVIKQDFEMIGTGHLSFLGQEGGDGISIIADLSDAYVLRSYADGEVTERMRFEGTGWLSFNGGDNNSSSGAFGQVHMFYYETWDEDGFRRLENIQLEANATARLSGPAESFSFDLDDFIFREKWEEGIRTDQFTRIFGSGDFDFIASEETPYIEVNGTIPILHIESEGGETVSNTIIVDGTYDGDAEGSFGLVRRITESGVFENATGIPFEADKVQNERWFNISATPIGPIDQEFEAEHNLTYEYIVPQEDWLNRTIRYEFVEENGSATEEYPENSPIIRQAESPQSNSIFSDHISRETGLSPQTLLVGDRLSLMDNEDMILQVNVTSTSIQEIDGHFVSVAEWNGSYGDLSMAQGKIINEGTLAGMLYEVSRVVTMGVGDGELGNQVSFIENQRIDRILSPSIITSEENTLPSISKDDSSVRFREGILTSEGGEAHLEVSVDDIDTDTISVSADLSGIGLGVIQLSDSGTKGDRVIHDSTWTSKIVYSGLIIGEITIIISMQDIWGSATENSSIFITNAPPRMLDAEFSPQKTIRGEEVIATVQIYDGHGIESATVDLTGSGGEKTNLQKVSEEERNIGSVQSPQSVSIETWSGEFLIPTSMTPGSQSIPIEIRDNAGARITTSEIGKISPGQYSNKINQIEILNQPPMIYNLTILMNGQSTDSISSPVSGDPINHTLEVNVDDFDGVSSVQAKIGRLAPIGKSENWILLADDGNGSDRVKNDGIYTLSFSTRSSLGEGEMKIFLRATDIFLSMTPMDEQEHQVSVIKTSESNSGENWLSENSLELVTGSLVILTFSGIGALVFTLRKSELE